MPSARILIADDFDDWRVQICSILHDRTEWQIIDEACDGLQAVQKAAALQPDVVLLDVGMPVLNGVEAAVQIQRVSPNSKIVFVTQESDPEVRRAVLVAGAHAFVLKSHAAYELVPTIEAILRVGDRPA